MVGDVYREIYGGVVCTRQIREQLRNVFAKLMTADPVTVAAHVSSLEQRLKTVPEANRSLVGEVTMLLVQVHMFARLHLNFRSRTCSSASPASIQVRRGAGGSGVRQLQLSIPHPQATSDAFASLC